MSAHAHERQGTHSIDRKQLKQAFVALITAGEYAKQTALTGDLCEKCYEEVLDFIPATNDPGCTEPMTLEGAEALTDKAIRDAWLLCTGETILAEQDPVDFINEAE